MRLFQCVLQRRLFVTRFGAGASVSLIIVACASCTGQHPTHNEWFANSNQMRRYHGCSRLAEPLYCRERQRRFRLFQGSFHTATRNAFGPISGLPEAITKECLAVWKRGRCPAEWDKS